MFFPGSPATVEADLPEISVDNAAAVLVGLAMYDLMTNGREGVIFGIWRAVNKFTFSGINSGINPSDADLENGNGHSHQ